MKLHLPKGLRSAVLACIAIAGGFATTVGTGIITGGALTIAFAASQAQAVDKTVAAGEVDEITSCVYDGTIIVEAGGTINLAGDDCLGWWGGTRTQNLLVGGGEETATVVVSARQTFSTNLELKGNAVIKAAEGTIVDPSDSGYNAGSAPSFDCFHPAGTISASGTGNVIGINIVGRDNTPNPVNISVADGGDLTITGSIRIRTQGIGIGKNGGGLLTISSDHNYLHKGYTNNAGTTVIDGAFAVDTGVYVNGGTMKVTADGTLTLGNSISVASGATFENLGTVAINTNTYATDLVFSKESDVVKASKTYEIYSGEGTVTGLTSVKFGETTVDVVDGVVFIDKKNAADIEGVVVEGSTITMSNNALSDNFVVESGITLKQTGNDQMGVNYLSNTSRTITVGDGGTLDVSGHEAYYHVVLEEGATLTNSGGDVGTGNRSLPVLDLKGDATVSSDVRFGILGSGYGATDLNLNGNTLTKEGSGVFHLRNTAVDSGVINVKGGTLEWLAGTVMNEETEIILGSGATLDAQIDANRGLHALTGNGGKVVIADGQTLTVSEISGTSLTREGNGMLAINTIYTPEDLTITGGVVGNNVQKIGAGKLTIDSLTLTSSSMIQMNGEGTTTVKAATLADGAFLTYSAKTGAMSFTTTTMGEGHVNIDLLAIMDDLQTNDIVDLGLSSGFDTSKLTIFGLTSNYEYITSGSNLQLKFTDDVSFETSWDFNWGAAGLAGAPEKVESKTIGEGDTALGGVASGLTGGHANASVFGGAINDSFTGDAWILATDGSYKLITGGNFANNWSSGTRADFIGNSHVVVDGATVGTVIGGNYKDGQGAYFEGDSYISVKSGNVTGAVVGAGLLTHNSTTTHRGDTNIFIYTPLTGTTNENGEVVHTRLHDEAGNMVVGGFAWAANVAKSHTVQGNTNITVDLTGVEGTASFDKIILGGNYAWNRESSPMHKVGGTTNITLNLDDHATNEMVIGGNYSQYSRSSIGGANITIDGGTFNGNIYGGNYCVKGGGAQEMGDVVIALNGGTISGSVYGAGYHAGSGASTTGSVTVKVGSGVTFSGEGQVLSGGYQTGDNAGAATIEGDSTLEFTGTKDISAVSLNNFNVYKVATGVTGTVGSLTAGAAGISKTGAGTLKLSSPTVIMGSMLVSEGSLSLAGGNNLVGAIEVHSGATLDVSAGVVAKNGFEQGIALTMAEGATLSLATDKTLDLSSGTLTLGGKINLTLDTTISGECMILTGVSSLTGAITLGSEAVAADTLFSSITVNDASVALGDYQVKMDGTNMVLVSTLGKTVVWDANNSVWKNGAQFGGSTAASDIFRNGDVAQFNALTGENVTEPIVIDGTGSEGGVVSASSVSITAGAGNTYSFSSDSDGKLETSTMVIGEGTAKFNAGSLNLDSLESLTVNKDGILDVGALLANESIPDCASLVDKLTIAQGEGTVYLGDSLDIMKGGGYTFNINLQASGRLGFNGWGGNSLTVDLKKGLTIRQGENGQGDLGVMNGVTLNVNEGGTINAAGTIALGHSEGAGYSGHLKLINGGSITANSITKAYHDESGEHVATGNTFTMTGGTLELTGDKGIEKDIIVSISGGTLKAGANSWSIAGASIGGAIIATGDGTITLTDATLTSGLTTESGKVAFSGTINLNTTNYLPTYTSEEIYSETTNGYMRTDKVYQVVTHAANADVSDATWTVDGSDATYDNGSVTLTGQFGTEFYLRTKDELYSNLKGTEHAGMTAVVLARTGESGGGLNLNVALKDGVKIKVQTDNSIVHVGSKVVLKANQVESGATNRLDLRGDADGIFALTAGSSSLGDGVVLNNTDWKGIVQVTDAVVTDLDLNSLGNAVSTVQLSRVSGSLASGQTYVSAVSGDAAFTHTAATAGSYTFSGDVSGWTGSFGMDAEGATAELAFTGSSAINAAVTETAGTLNLTIDGEAKVTMNGAVDVTDLTVECATEFTGSVGVSGTLTNKGGMSLSQDLTLAGQLAGTGSVSGGNLTLLGAENSVGALTLTGDLTLGAAATESSAAIVSKLSASSLTLGADSSVVFNALGEGMLTVNTLSSDLNVSIDAALLEVMIQDGTSSLDLMTLTNIGDYTLSLNEETDGYEIADGQYILTLNRDESSGKVTLLATSQGKVWGGNEADPADDSLWSTGLNWYQGSAPSTGSESYDSVVFDGRGSSEIIVDGFYNVANMTFATKSDLTNPVTEYKLSAPESGDSEIHVRTNIAVNNGSTVNIGTNVYVYNHTRIATGGVVEILDGYKLQSQNGIENNGTIINNYDVIVGTGVSNTAAAADVLTNNGTIENTANGRIIIGKDLVNVGTVNSSGTIEVFGAVSNTGDISLTGGTATIGTANTDADVTSLDNEGGSISIDDGASLTVNGSIDNTNGQISIGSAGTDETPATTGSLTVTGDLTHAGEGSSLIVESDSSLTVGGNLAAEGMTLEFGGIVSVGGTATIEYLQNDGSLSAQNANIGKLTGSGSLDIKDKGKLSIGTLEGTGNITVGEGGTLKITNDTEFHGKLDNQGSVEASGNLTLHDQTLTGGNLEAGSLTIKEAANGSVADSLKTNSIIIEKLSDDPILTLGSLEVKDASSGLITLEMQQMQTKDGVDSIIADVKAAGGGVSYHLLKLTNGANVDGLLEYTEDEVLHQYLLKEGYTHSDLVSTTTYDSTGNTNVYIGFWEQELEEATWDTAGNTTEAGLILGELKDDTMTMLSNDMLDNVKSVNVTVNTTLNLGSDDAAAVNIHGLTGSGVLTVVGNGDTVNVDDADVTSMATGLNLSGVTANLNLSGKTVTAGEDVTLNGQMTGGKLSLDSTIGIATDSTLDIDGTALDIAYDDKGATVMDVTGVSATDYVLVDLGKMTGSAGDIVIGKDGKASALLDKYFSNIRFDSTSGAIVADRNSEYYSDSALGAGMTLSDNGAAGMKLADAALLNLNPQANTPTGGLAQALNAIEAAVAAGSASKVDELGAALAGASTAVLGMAAQGDVDRQLQAIRNRTTTMGVDQGVVHPDIPYFNAWINAEGDRRELSDNGTEGGYELNSWGGTVGFDVDFTPTFTAGLALTAMKGDLDATGVDAAKGDLDTTYVTAFARYCASAWTHTFVATVGKSDITLDRTVMGNELKGETEGMSFGIMYEVGRVYALTEDATACIQPVFNVTWRHTAMDGYTEEGGDLALEVDDQTLNTVTFGLGARMQAVVGENMYNRASIFECRLMAKADVGDRRGSSDVALAGTTAEVESAEMGPIGIEAGAGLTIPLGEYGSSLFMDASVEFRADYTNVNGTVGYRLNF